MSRSVVVDTNVFIGAFGRGDSANRKILELCFLDEMQPLMGDALFHEYEDVLERDLPFAAVFNAQERQDFFDDFCSVCRWVDIYFRLRPNLRDEGDNHIVELALAGGARTLITWNKRDFKGGELLLPDLEIMTPAEFLRVWKSS